MYRFVPTGVCAKEILFDVTDGKIANLKFHGGCPGSLEALTRLLEGQELEAVISSLSGVTCGKKSTSCPDQLSKVLADIHAGNADAHKAPALGKTGLGASLASLSPFN